MLEVRSANLSAAGGICVLTVLFFEKLVEYITIGYYSLKFFYHLSLSFHLLFLVLGCLIVAGIGAYQLMQEGVLELRRKRWPVPL